MSAPANSGERLHSLDALRGFDMLWILGGNALLVAWANSNDWRWLDWAKGQTEHVEWHGFTFWDLIFPLFLFVAGASLPFSFAARRARGDGDTQLALHAVRRGLVLVALGLVYNGLLRFDFEQLRCASVLGRIGLAWMFAALISLRFGLRGRLIAIATLLFGYWAALACIPVPGHGAGVLEPGATLTDWLDRKFLPGALHRGDRDPEGLFATVPAIATALLGVLAGEWLRRRDTSELRKVAGLVVAGALALGLGALWDLAFPFNKNLWTSSFVLWTAGWSAVLLAAFYLLVDVWRFRRASFVLEVIGLNAITIYLLQAFVDFDALSKLILAKAALKVHPALLVGGALALKWLLLYVLWRARIFLRV